MQGPSSSSSFSTDSTDSADTGAQDGFEDRRRGGFRVHAGDIVRNPADPYRPTFKMKVT